MTKSFTLNNTSDSILSRICLVSLIWLLLILGGFSSRAWGDNTATITRRSLSDTDWSNIQNGNTSSAYITWKGNDAGQHVTFRLSGGTFECNSDWKYFRSTGNQTHRISWTVDAGYTISVKEILVASRASTNYSTINVGPADTKTNPYTGLSGDFGTFSSGVYSPALGNSGSVDIVYTSGNITNNFIKTLTISYTIVGPDETVMFDGTADWGNNGTEKYKPDSFKIDAPHVTFSLQKEMKQYNSGSGKKTHEYFYLTSDEEKAPLRWWVEPGYTINVKSIIFDSRNQRSWGTTGKGYVCTSRGKELRVRQDDSRGTNAFAVSDGGADNLFGNPATPLTNNEYFRYLKATSKEWNIYGITLTYTINPNSYTVTLDSEGGSDGSENVTMTFDSNIHGAITNPTLDGCTFEGWYSGDNGTGSLIIAADGTLQENTIYTGAGGVWKKDSTGISLHAKWSGVPYSVRFNGNGSTDGSMDDQDFEYGTAQNLTANAFEKTCTVTYDANEGSCGIASSTTPFPFLGWATSEGGDVVYANGAEVGNLTSTSGAVFDLYAKWATVADTIVLPTPTKDGYVFLGWYNSSNVLVGDAGGPYTPTGSETLEARWVQALTSTVNKSTLLDNFDGDAKSVSWSTEHVTFTLAGDGLKEETWLGTTHFYLYATNSKAWQYDLTWTIDSKDAEGNSAYTISVKKVTFDIERASGLNTYMTIEGRRSGNIYANGNIPSGGISSGTLSKGENETVTTLIETSDVFWSNIVLNNVTVIYTLEPIINVASEQSVAVTICDEEKQLLDLSTCASLADQSGHIALNYSLIGDNADNAHKTLDNKFYADVVDTYRVRASVDAVADCHSGKTVEFTINVTPATLELTPPTASSITYHNALSASTLTGGSAVVGDCPVEGTWEWQDPSYEPTSVGNGQSFNVVFTPNVNASYYTNFVTTTTLDVLRAEIIFDGSGSTNDQWINDLDWQDDTKPMSEDIAVIRHDVVITEQVSAYCVRIEGTNTVTIAPTGGLTVGAGGISGASKNNFFIRAENDANSAYKGQTGYLRISPSYTTMPEVTMELLRQGYTNSGVAGSTVDITGYSTWQYVGCPVKAAGKKVKQVIGGWINSWDEKNHTWVNNRDTLKVYPFRGFANSQDVSSAGAINKFKGTLLDNTNYNVQLACTGETDMSGWNLLANSYSAPIDIKAMLDNCGADVEHAVYIFNTGNTGNVVDTAGTYTTITKALAGTTVAEIMYQGVIPAMQGFFVKANSACTFTFNYANAVWNATYSGASSNKPMRAPERVNNESEKEVISISLEVNGKRDKVLLIEQEEYSTDFENGYDAHIMPVGSFNIFTIEGEDDYLAVDATSSIIGTRVGVRTGEETAYTMTFNYVSDDAWALYDSETEQTLDINEGMQYTFFAEPNAMITERFEIVARADAPAITTGVDKVENGAKVHKFIKGNQLFILKNGVLYNATGAVVR